MSDLIKREDAIKYFAEFLSLNRFADFKNVNIEKLVGKLCERIPSAEPKQGKWIRKESWSRGVGMGEVYGWYFECSVCGCLSEGSVYDAGNFCANCGAKMKGADDE